jgi:hypothetical protein
MSADIVGLRLLAQWTGSLQAEFSAMADASESLSMANVLRMHARTLGKVKRDIDGHIERLTALNETRKDEE